MYIYTYITGDQKISLHLMITIQKAGAQRLFDHPVYISDIRESYKSRNTLWGE